MMSVMAEEAFEPTSWIRWTDNCTAQFKSQYTLYDLANVRTGVSPSIATARFSTFEPGESKNASDGLGSFDKQAIDRTTMTTMDGLGDEPMAITEEMARRLIAGLNFKDGNRVGGFSFFR